MTRPLGAFSNFVCNSLGTKNEQIRQGVISAVELFDTANNLLSAIPVRIYDQLVRDTDFTRRRLAILDLVWVVRSLDVAFAEDANYAARSKNSMLQRVARMLADREGRHPNLSWSDIAIYHPVGDPRSFLPPGAARDQEIFMYRSQHAIEKTLRYITDLHEREEVTAEILPILPVALNAVVKTMVRLNRERTPGHFYTLDPFLGPNNKFTGHATGAFSAWCYIVGYFLSEHHDFKQRLLRPENRMAFDRDADPHIKRIENGTFRTADQLIGSSGLGESQYAAARALLDSAQEKFGLFLHAHRGTIKRHASSSFDDVAPANISIINRESLNRGIAGIVVGKPV
ncbi:MAG: hypothetical protein JWN03_7035 [Nocardia sp.]|nr:hypothetical protein [Nocardia sp.]